MDELRAWYREGLVARIEALEAARAGLARGDAEAEQSLRRLAHSLRGSGGTYGYPEITEAAAAVEEAPRELLPARLEILLETLRRAVASGEDERIVVLLVEDDAGEAQRLCERLAGPSREVVLARTGEEAERLLHEREIALVLLDLILPDMDGRNLLVRLRDNPRTAAVPVVVLAPGPQPRTECFALGADDYFVRPIDHDALLASVTSRLQRAAELSRQARHDVLTGLPNRATFNEAYERAIGLAARAGEPLALAFIDLDNFKAINDTYGHATGDAVLRKVADILRRSLRKCDLVARWGGEEFAALLPGANAEGAARAIERALEQLRATPFTAGGESFSVTFSAGVVDVEGELPLERALAEADRRLYLAKEAGRARVVVHDSEKERPRHRLVVAEDDEQLAQTLRRALEREGFEVRCCASGQEALETIERDGASLLLLDVRLPDRDGFEILQRLRRSRHGARLPVVILTAMGSDADVVRGFELGADDYVLKPFSLNELLARVRRLLQRRRTPPAQRPNHGNEP